MYVFLGERNSIKKARFQGKEGNQLARQSGMRETKG